MKTGYMYLGVVWPSIADCEEMALTVYEEKIYTFAMRRLADSPNDWQQRVAEYDRELKAQAHRDSLRRWNEIIIMEEKG